MEYSSKVSRWKGSFPGAGGPLAVAMLAGLFLTTPVSHAQQPAPAKQPAQAAPAKQPAAPAKQSKGEWIKLCADREALSSQATRIKQTVCVVQQERISMANGSMIVSAGIRQISGTPNEALVVQMSLLPNITGSPFGLAIPPGAQVKVDDGKEHQLKFSYCHVGGCTAEALATKEILAEMKKGKNLVVIFTNSLNKRLGLPLPLSGFTKAYDGKPFDTAVYQKERQALLAAIRKRQIELAKRAAVAASQEKTGRSCRQCSSGRSATGTGEEALI